MVMARRNQRSAEAEQWRKLYKTSRWQKLRARQLRHEPLCSMCQARGEVTPATVADHVVPHKGDERLFFQGATQSLCAPCHSGAKQSEERRGYSTEVGLDGWPVSPHHPAYRG